MGKAIIVALCLFLSVPAYAGSFADESGRVFEVKNPFSRVISLYGAHTENLFSLGLDREIIGVSQNEVFPSRALEKPAFSYHDDAEKFMAARPDLVLIRPMIARAYAQFVRKLESAGITVVSLQPGSVPEIRRYWRILGMLTGTEARAEEMIRDFQEAVRMIKALGEGIPPEKRKRVYFEAIHRRMKTFYRDSMAMFALETAGGVNIAKDAPQVRTTNIAAYGKERILAKAGEIDVYLAQRGTMNPVSLEMITEETGFHIIKAVRDRQIHFVDELIVSRPTLRLTRGMFEIGRVLYPEVFTPKVGEEIGKMTKQEPED